MPCLTSWWGPSNLKSCIRIRNTKHFLAAFCILCESATTPDSGPRKARTFPSQTARLTVLWLLPELPAAVWLHAESRPVMKRHLSRGRTVTQCQGRSRSDQLERMLNRLNPVNCSAGRKHNRFDCSLFIGSFTGNIKSRQSWLAWQLPHKKKKQRKVHKKNKKTKNRKAKGWFYFNQTSQANFICVPHFQNNRAPMKDIKLCLVAGVQEGKKPMVRI